MAAPKATEAGGIEIAGGDPFRTKTVVLFVTGGVLAFFAFLLLFTFSDELQGAEDGEAHAMSVSATGYRAAAELIERMDGDVAMSRNASREPSERLYILTPRVFTNPELLAERARHYSEIGYVMIVLPKYYTRAMQEDGPDLDANPAWAERTGTIGIPALEQLLSGLGTFSIAEAVPVGTDSGSWYDGFRTISGGKLEAFLTDGDGRFAGAWMGEEDIAIVPDGNMMNNLALAKLENAERLLEIIDTATFESNRKVTFDLTLNGFESGESALKRAFTPPLLGVTLAALLTAIFAGLAAAVRFGPALREARAVEYGKQALLDNSADMIKLTRREEASAASYIDVIRRAAARDAGLVQTAAPDVLDKQLDRFGGEDAPKFTGLTFALYSATTRSEILGAAQALHQWKKDIFA
ncbi:MAG: hypothetical protein WA979_07880 [Pacificimonas sp.]